MLMNYQYFKIFCTKNNKKITLLDWLKSLWNSWKIFR